MFSGPVHCSGEKTRDDGGEDLRSGTPGGSSGGALNQVIGVLVVIVLVLPTLVLGQRFFFGPSAGKESLRTSTSPNRRLRKTGSPKKSTKTSSDPPRSRHPTNEPVSARCSLTDLDGGCQEAKAL